MVIFIMISKIIDENHTIFYRVYIVLYYYRVSIEIRSVITFLTSLHHHCHRYTYAVVTSAEGLFDVHALRALNQF